MRILTTLLIVFVFLFGWITFVQAEGEDDGISTYKSTEADSVASVFGSGENVYVIYVMVMDWVPNKRGSSTATAYIFS